MKYINLTGGKETYRLEDTFASNPTDAQVGALESIYHRINNKEIDTESAARAIILRLLRWEPTMKPVTVVLPKLPADVECAVKRHASRTNYRMVKLTGSQDSLGNQKYQHL